MFCEKCGRYNPDKAEKCRFCGGPVNKDVAFRAEYKSPASSTHGHQNAGFLLTWFFGIIAAVIGTLVCYDDSEKRSSFVKGALQGFLLNIITSIIIFAITYGRLVAALRQILR